MSTDGLVRQRDRDRDAIFRPKVSRDVALTCRIFDQIDVARTDRGFLSSRNFHFSPAAERDYELTPRPYMPVVRVVWRPAAELHAGRFNHFRRVAIQFYLN